MRTTTNHLRILSIGAALAWSSSAPASVVVTQIEERAQRGLWLLSNDAQQGLAHQQIINAHDVSAVQAFDGDSLSGVDIVYISPALVDELQLTSAEIDALEDFVVQGGRVIIPADNGMWAVAFAEFAARFDVSYGPGFVNGQPLAVVEDFDNPIINGGAGVVNSFNGASPNDDLNSTNPDFRVVARWQKGDQSQPATYRSQPGKSSSCPTSTPGTAT